MSGGRCPAAPWGHSNTEPAGVSSGCLRCSLQCCASAWDPCCTLECKNTAGKEGSAFTRKEFSLCTALHRGHLSCSEGRICELLILDNYMN